MVKIGNWKKVDNTPNYIVWSLPQKPMHNPHSVVVKTEMGMWVTFVDMGKDGGTSVIARPKTKAQSIKYAINYMKSHPRG